MNPELKRILEWQQRRNTPDLYGNPHTRDTTKKVIWAVKILHLKKYQLTAASHWARSFLSWLKSLPSSEAKVILAESDMSKLTPVELKRLYSYLRLGLNVDTSKLPLFAKGKNEK